MSFIAKSFSAIGRLVVVGVLLAAFLVAMAGVVYLSLSGSEVKVPDIVGKDFVESEKELASLGLKIRRRADRVSTDPINTVVEQLPKPGETVKSGQWVSVVVSKVGAGDEAPPSLKQNVDEDDTEKIEEMISDKPKKARANTNANTNKKKADTTRDVIANTSTSNSNDTKAAAEGDKKDPSGETKAAGKDDKTDGPKPQNTPNRPNTIKPPAGEPRSRP